MSPEQMWKEFTDACPEFAGREYEAWPYGGAPDELAELTLRGVKTATASAHSLYELEGAPLPRPGDMSVVLDGSGGAVCVLQTSRVTVLPFLEVSARHAWLEGEGDRSLAYWREVHEAFFTHELREAGLEFTPDMKVVCEEFEVLWPRKV